MAVTLAVLLAVGGALSIVGLRLNRVRVTGPRREVPVLSFNVKSTLLLSVWPLSNSNNKLAGALMKAR